MDAIRRSFKNVKRCRKTMWKSLKKTHLLSCFRRGTSKRTADDTPYGVTDKAVETLTVSRIHCNIRNGFVENAGSIAYHRVR